MDIFKTKAFDKWAKKERLKNTELIQAINEIEKGLVDADLGSGIYKKRISQNNRGKSACARSFIAYKAAQKAFFLYGFPKNARSNITEKETQALKRMAKEVLNYSHNQLERLIKNQELMRVKDDD